MRFLASLSLSFVLLSCSPPELPPPPPPPPLAITRVEMSSEPVEAGKPLPALTQHFEEGTRVLYAYVWFENVRTMTGGFPVGVQWFHPNDLRPPIAMSQITMTPRDTIAQFSLHNEAGMAKGPYQVLFFGGKDASATGSTRFFVGMTPEEAGEFLKEEAEVRERMEEERARREKEAEEAKESKEAE